MEYHRVNKRMQQIHCCYCVTGGQQQYRLLQLNASSDIDCDENHVFVSTMQQTFQGESGTGPGMYCGMREPGWNNYELHYIQECINMCVGVCQTTTCHATTVCRRHTSQHCATSLLFVCHVTSIGVRQRAYVTISSASPAVIHCLTVEPVCTQAFSVQLLCWSEIAIVIVFLRYFSILSQHSFHNYFLVTIRHTVLP